MTFCTLFDTYYLDKGLTLYHSLEKVCDDFSLYIFCFDEKSKQILEQEALSHAIILSHHDLEENYPNLLQLKEERSKAEYCWTCTPASIEYVLNHFHEEHCIYIDADLFFFEDPKILLSEIQDAKADIVITEHRFTNSLKDRHFLKRSGKYCVEFNYFNQSPKSRECLKWWKEQCFAWCYHLYEAERMGDQKYLEKFPTLFQGVHELQHLGGGTAPWNIKQYKLVSTDEANHVILREKTTGNTFPLVFYHFQNIRYLSDKKVNINSCTQDKKVKDAIYVPYLAEVERVRVLLQDKYDISFSVNKSYASNPLIAFAQKYILQYKIRSFSDIYSLEDLR